VTPAAQEATRKAGACWVDLGEGPQLVWHAWHEDALWLVTGGQEQPLARSRDDAEVTVRTRTGEVVTWSGRATVVSPDSPEWAAAIAVLHDKRCNAPDGEVQPLRWARESVVLKISPT
jgi:hypothetical protein